MSSAPSFVFLVPGSIEGRTGGYEYDRRIAAGLAALGWSVDIRELDGPFPNPTPATLAGATRVLAAIPDGSIVVIDGLASSAMPEQIEHESSRLKMVALVHMPLGTEIGIDPDEGRRRASLERRALLASALVVVTGSGTLDAVVQHGVDRRRVVVVEPGTEPAPLARGGGAIAGTKGSPLELLCVATLNPGKGHEILFRALSAVRDRGWHVTCAGSLERSPATVERLRQLIRTLNLEQQVSFSGELHEEALAACYDRADVFVIATLRETFGMAVAEALARGLPVVATRTGAIPTLVGVEEAGLLVEPGDVEGLTVALNRVLDDRALRQRLAAGARHVREHLPTWTDASRKMAAALSRLTT
jgi:glycosyltransferase involved in cell wall biosynthesis